MAELFKKVRKTLTTKNVTQSVYKIGRYRTSSSIKATELTKLVESLVGTGIWPSAKDAAAAGVPAGTFIIVDDPNTDAQDFSVQIVPKMASRRVLPKDPGAIIKEA